MERTSTSRLAFQAGTGRAKDAGRRGRWDLVPMKIGTGDYLKKVGGGPQKKGGRFPPLAGRQKLLTGTGKKNYTCVGALK